MASLRALTLLDLTAWFMAEMSPSSSSRDFLSAVAVAYSWEEVSPLDWAFWSHFLRSDRDLLDTAALSPSMMAASSSIWAASAFAWEMSSDSLGLGFLAPEACLMAACSEDRFLLVHILSSLQSNFQSIQLIHFRLRK